MLDKWDEISLDEVLVASGFEMSLIDSLAEKTKAVDERTEETAEMLKQKGYQFSD